jgi:exopolysaccharide biosynthesis polyprenyl glycosylphosphotransferase
MEVQLQRVPLAISAGACPEAPVLSLKLQRLILTAWLMATDALMLGLAFYLAYWMRFNLHLTIAPEVVPNPEFYPILAALLTPLSILVFIPFRLYEPHSLLGGVSEYSRTFNACSTGTMIVVLGTFLIPQFVVSRLWVVSAWLFSFALVALNRFVCRRMVYALRQRGYFLTPAVIVGTNQEAVSLAADLGQWRSSGLRIMGFVSSNTRKGLPVASDLRVLGSISDIQTIVQKYGVEDLVVAITALNREELLQLCEEVNPIAGVQLKLSSGLYELLTTRVTVRRLGRVPLVSLNKFCLEPEEMCIKTVLESSLAIVALMLLSPLLFLLVLLIKLDSKGPIIYRRRVLGVSGNQFDAFKFRTMHVNGDELLKFSPKLVELLRTNHKLKEDPRVTRMGRWLRKYSLDELPQLFNVLRGQMGLVGPRIISPEEVEKYGQHKLNLLTVKPGITGLWQVSGRSDLSYDERMRLDMYYIRNYSVWLDLQILFVQTIPAVLNGRGAY